MNEYEHRYFLSDGTILTKEEFDKRFHHYDEADREKFIKFLNERMFDDPQDGS